MKGKILSLFLFAVILSSLVYAADLSFGSFSNDLSKSVLTSSIILANSNATLPYIITIKTPISITDDSSNIITITPNEISFTLPASSSKTIKFTAALPAKLSLGTFSTPIIAQFTNSTGGSENITATLNFVSSYCQYGDNSTDLEITKLSDEELDNKNSWKWAPLDNVEISVKVHNAYSDDLDVILQYGLYKPSTKEFIDLDEDTIDMSINDGKTEEATIKFQVPSDIDEGTYRFYVKAYEDGSEKARCTSVKGGDYYQEVEINKESRSVILDAIKLESSYTCGETVEIRADLANIGTDDEDQVLVIASNKELGLDAKKVIDSLDSGDSEELSFSFKIPSNLADKTYNVALRTYYRYDDGNSGCSNDEQTACYDRNSMDDLDREFLASFKLEGCVQIPTSKAEISAVLQSSQDAVKPGNNIIIKATITNTGTEQKMFLFDVEGEESFASVQTIEPFSATLNKGESKDVLITLKLNKDSAGEHVFSIKALFDNQQVSKQLSLSIPSSSGSFSNWFSGLKGNWFIWVIVLINVVLILAIIIVAVKLARA